MLFRKLKEEHQDQTLVPYSALTVQSHEDEDYHLIGESLPSPSYNSENGGSSGESPYPAREDHVHGFTVIDDVLPATVQQGGWHYLAGWIVKIYRYGPMRVMTGLASWDAAGEPPATLETMCTLDTIDTPAETSMFQTHINGNGTTVRIDIETDGDVVLRHATGIGDNHWISMHHTWIVGN